MNENMENRSELLVKWLRVLMYIAIASLINSIISFLPIVPATITTWISRGVMVAMIVCMFQLVPAHPRYQKAGIYRGVMLALTFITSLLFASSFLTLVASVFSIMAVYQEYSAHSELVAEKDAKLSGKWHSLFNWGIFAGLLTGFGSVVVALIVAMLEMDAVRLVSIIVAILSIPQLILDVVYLMYIKKMIAIFDEGEVQGYV